MRPLFHKRKHERKCFATGANVPETEQSGNLIDRCIRTVQAFQHSNMPRPIRNARYWMPFRLSRFEEV
eukprot:Awhi_evm1s294